MMAPKGIHARILFTMGRQEWPSVILLSVMSKETAPVSLGWLLLGLVSRSFWPHSLPLHVADSCFSGSVTWMIRHAMEVSGVIAPLSLDIVGIPFSDLRCLIFADQQWDEGHARADYNLQLAAALDAELATSMIKGVSDVLASSLEHGVVKPGEMNMAPCRCTHADETHPHQDGDPAFHCGGFGSHPF